MKLSPYSNTPQDYMEVYGDDWIKEWKFDKKAIADPSQYKKRYYKEVWELTESNKEQIEGIENRGLYQEHIDHKIPISVGWKNNIPKELIAHPSNLQMMWWKDNMEKNNSITVDKENEWIAESYKLDRGK